MKYGTKLKKVITEADGNIIGKAERPQRNSWFDEECQIMLEDKKGAYNKMIKRNTRKNEQEYKDKRKEGHIIIHSFSSLSSDRSNVSTQYDLKPPPSADSILSLP